MGRETPKRVAVITGGTKGIGFAIARNLGLSDIAVFICARDQDGINQSLTELGSLGISCAGTIADMTTVDGIENCIQGVIKKFGSINYLIHNAGGAIGKGHISELSDSNWIDTFSINVLALVRLVALAKPFLISAKNSRVVNIGSINATEPGFLDPHYSSAKAAAANLVKYLSNDLAPYGVTVNSVSSGPVRTNSWETSIEDGARKRNISKNEFRDEIESEMESRIPLGEIGESSQIANLVSFLISEEARWITGSNFRIDGGKSRAW